MALNAAVVLRVRPGGHDTNNGGGFRPGVGGTDRSQQDAAHVSLTVAATVHTTTTMLNVPSGQHTVSAADVGNLYQINGGTATAGIYEITAADVGNNRWTLDRSAGTSAQTAPGGMGGALASPGRAGQVKVNGNLVYVYSGTYVMSASSNVAGGRVTEASTGASTAPNRWIGEGPTRPVWKTGANSVTLFTGSGVFAFLEGMELRRDTAAGHTGATGCSLSGGGCQARDCYAYDCQNQGFISTTGSNIRIADCYASSCGAGFSAVGSGYTHFSRCVSVGHTSQGFYSNTGTFTALFCAALNGSAVGFQLQNASNFLYGCLAYGNTGATHGFQSANASGNQWLINCLAVNNGTSGTAYGFASMTGGVVVDRLINCAAYGNRTADYDPNFPAVSLEDFLSLTANPFTDAAGLNFALNNTAGGGALLRAAGYPASFPGLSTSSYPDIGPAQHADAGGGVSRYAACGRAF